MRERHSQGTGTRLESIDGSSSLIQFVSDFPNNPPNRKRSTCRFVDQADIHIAPVHESVGETDRNLSAAVG